MLSELPPAAVSYRVFVTGAGRVTVIGEQPDVAWKLCGSPSVATMVGETEQPESETVVPGPELATVICIMSFMFTVIGKLPVIPVLFPSPRYIAVIVAEDLAV
jgi:hypothetical protein